MVKEKALITLVIYLLLSFWKVDETSLLEKILDEFQILLSSNPQAQQALESTKSSIEFLEVVSFIAIITAIGISFFTKSIRAFLA
jgi:hypothetical protein